MKVRAGGAGDHDAAHAVWRAADAARRSGDPSPLEYGRWLRGYLEKPDTFLFVAEKEGGEVVGMSLGMQGLDVEGDGSEIPGLCHVGAVFVVPERWDEGIGGRLVDAVLSEAKSRGYERAQLWTHSDNCRARRLYEGRGFIASGRVKTDERREEMTHYHVELFRRSSEARSDLR